MVIKTSRWGKEFLACSGYPDCKNTRAVAGAEGGQEESPDGDSSAA